MPDVPKVYQPVCHCGAYRFPHRVGGGKCECRIERCYRGWGQPKLKVSDICESCGQAASGVEMDFGIGHYEFWGSVGFHTDVQVVSECCEASIIENTEANALAHRKEWFE